MKKFSSEQGSTRFVVVSPLCQELVECIKTINHTVIESLIFHNLQGGKKSLDILHCEIMKGLKGLHTGMGTHCRRILSMAKGLQPACAKCWLPSPPPSSNILLLLPFLLAWRLQDWSHCVSDAVMSPGGCPDVR